MDRQHLSLPVSLLCDCVMVTLPFSVPPTLVSNPRSAPPSPRLVTRCAGEWRSLLASLDKSVEGALRQTVKKSLQELSRAINGDQKVDAQSLFKVRWGAATSDMSKGGECMRGLGLMGYTQGV